MLAIIYWVLRQNAAAQVDEDLSIMYLFNFSLIQPTTMFRLSDPCWMIDSWVSLHVTPPRCRWPWICRSAVIDNWHPISVINFFRASNELFISCHQSHRDYIQYRINGWAFGRRRSRGNRNFLQNLITTELCQLEMIILGIIGCLGIILHIYIHNTLSWIRLTDLNYLYANCLQNYRSLTSEVHKYLWWSERAFSVYH